MNVNVAALDAKAVQQYAGTGKEMTTVDFLLNIIPDTLANAFAKGEILQVLPVSILAGLALAAVSNGRPLVEAIDVISRVLFGIVDLIMKAAPIGAFGAMAFTIGRYGLRSLLPLGKVTLCVGLSSACFVFIILAGIARWHGFSVLKLVKYLEEELLIVLGTSSSEPALPGPMSKLENAGCSKSVVGPVAFRIFIQSGWHCDLSDDCLDFCRTGHEYAAHD